MIEIYPAVEESTYWAEFNDQGEFRLFQRQNVEGTEVHPWQILCGHVEHPGIIHLHTRKGLELLVDALNAYRPA